MLGENLREARRKSKMTQAELGEAVGYSQAAVAMWEKGLRTPDLDTLYKLANILHMEPSKLFGEELPSYTDDEQELWNLREMVRRDPERHILFSLARDADIEDVRKAVAIIDALKKTREREQ